MALQVGRWGKKTTVRKETPKVISLTPHKQIRSAGSSGVEIEDLERYIARIDGFENTAARAWASSVLL